MMAVAASGPIVTSSNPVHVIIRAIGVTIENLPEFSAER